MSEHDEPKTALTPIEALLSWGVGRDTGGVDRLIPAEDLRRALEEARVLLAEGYTTSPAPEATGRCGYAIVDTDGIEEPCDRPATGWRWYQDVGDHEDLLDVACDHHQNEGGQRMARIAAENERLRGTLADVRAQHTEARRHLLAVPEATETVEWGVRYDDSPRIQRCGDEETAWYVAAYPTGPIGVNPVVVTRTRTFYADRVTEWVPVDRAADEHEEDS